MKRRPWALRSSWMGVAGLRLAHTRTVVLIHDSYHYVSEPAVRPVSERIANALRLGISDSLHAYFELIDRVDTLAVLRPRPLALERAAAGDAAYLKEYTRLLDSPGEDSDGRTEERRRGEGADGRDDGTRTERMGTRRGRKGQRGDG